MPAPPLLSDPAIVSAIACATSSPTFARLSGEGRKTRAKTGMSCLSQHSTFPYAGITRIRFNGLVHRTSQPRQGTPKFESWLKAKAKRSADARGCKPEQFLEVSEKLGTETRHG